MSKWQRLTVNELATEKGIAGGPFGSSLGGKDYVESGIPVIRGQNLGSNGKFHADGFVFVTPEKAEKHLSRNLAIPGDVVFTQRGTLGQVGVVPGKPFVRYVISQSQMRLRVNPKITTPDFIYYYFRSPAMIQEIRNRAITTGVPHINLGILKSFEVQVPSLREQHAITEVLTALDDKISINEQISQAAAELATTTYSHAVEKTPDHFTDTPLSSTAEFINGRAFTKNPTGTGRMVIRIAEINSGPGNSTVYNDIEAPEKHLANPGDILFAWSGSLTAQRWYRPQGIINQHIFKVVPKNDYPAWLAFELVKYKIADFQAIAADKATTMGHIQRRHLDETVPVPSLETISQLSSSLGPLWNRALVAEQEGLTLAELRDTLLPQLMSGKLRVKDAEKIVEDNV
ncbi:restriction endonuclease subunit S [Nocardiopsis sp. RV163]|uniref:restriction endonuclease subunit S n=1 Tax=Nocardiopsis sp. RV163 TaxID=1661388 RepID=UPI0009E45F0E|nr:restriction endonuclease subunit S [Nocardiopsis sp. RV163]